MEDRLTDETRKMLAKDKVIPEGRTVKKKEISETGKRKFIFKTRGRIIRRVWN